MYQWKKDEVGFHVIHEIFDSAGQEEYEAMTEAWVSCK
jgi:hypothetical protein